MELEGTIQLVTGAGSGLGKKSAQYFAEQGASVVCADLNLSAAEETVKSIELEGGRAIAVKVDVADWTSVQGMSAQALDAYGRVDGVFANAGLPGAGSVVDVEISSWSRTLDVNLTGAMLTARAFVPVMREAGGGSILFTASISGLKAFPNQVAYAASKGGVIAMARQMSHDLAGQNIRVNSLCPGLVVTPLVEELYRKRAEHTGIAKEEALKAMGDRYPLGRTGRAEDMASMASFLQSKKADWITGQSFTVDGGISA